ncbi:MAG: DUF58 domain-containing protein, partial [Ekhidna sp.]|nr:DUF58 domain-containing protein [Ekhidna sp.]
EIINKIFSFKPKSKKTHLDGAIKYTLNLLNRKSIIFIISDFLDENFTHSLRGLARKHDLIVMHVSDKSESVIPQLGIVPLLEKESGKTIWMNTSSQDFKKTFEKTYGSKKESLADFCKRNDVNYVSIGTEEEYVPKLIKLFRHRNRGNAQRTR